MDKLMISKKEKAIRGLAKGLTIFFMALMFIYCLTLVLPLVWLLINSFKDPIDFYLQKTLVLPKKWELSNYSTVFEILKYDITTASGYKVSYDVLGMTLNSLYYSLGSAIYSVITITVVGYAVGRYNNPLTKILYTVGVLVMIIPFTTDGGTSLLLKKQLGIYDNLTMTILMSGGCIFTGQFFFIMVAHFEKLGKEYAEAASMDGAGQFTIMTRIMLPLSIPLMTVIFVLAFISAWNNYGTFLFYLPSYANLALGMYTMQAIAPIKGYSTPQVLAGFVVVAIPVIALYAFTQPIIQKNLNIGGLKG